MNYSTAVMLINDNIKAVLCTYEVDTDKTKAPRVMFKTLDHSIKEGDLVIVPSNTRHERTIVKVVEFDAEVDFDSHTHVDWIVGKLDQSVFENITKEEAKAVDAIKAAEKLKRRRDIRANIDALHADNLAALPIANMNSSVPTAIADQTKPDAA